MDDTSASLLRFGIFELNLKTGELRKAGSLVNLPPQPFKILVLLAGSPGQLITREEIQREIWGNDTFVDFEKGLNFAIRRIRASLGDDAEVPRYIETLPRRGYRFIATVEVANPANPVVSFPPTTLTTQPEIPPPPVQRKSWRAAFLGVIFLIVGGSLLAAWLLSPRRHPIRSLAVLPLENLSQDPQQEYFVDGMTDEMITELARIAELRVISRTSSMRYKGVHKSLTEIARELNVDAVVEGTVSRSGSQIRIRIQLIRATPEEHLWAETFESGLSDILAVQSKVAKAIAQEIRIKLTPEEQTQLSRTQAVNPDALDAYLMGRYKWSKREPALLQQSIDDFKTAIDKDPTYPRAWAGLADSYDILNDYDLSAPEYSYPKAIAAAKTALKLDPTLGEAHATLASVKAQYEWDWPGAETEFKQAIKLNPTYATAHQWYSEYLLRCGRFDEAMSEIKRAHELDPLSPIINAEIGGDLYFARRYDEAIERLRTYLQTEPGLGYAHSWLGFAYAKKQMFSDAIAEFENAIRVSGESPSFKANLGYALGLSGKTHKARAIAEELEARRKQKYFSAYSMALVYMGLDEPDLAFQRLEEAYKAHDPALNLVKIDPALDSLRSDPRFKSLQQRIGL